MRAALSWAGAWLKPDAEANPIQMGKELQRHFVPKNEIGLTRQQLVVDRDYQPQTILVAELNGEILPHLQ